MTEAQRIAENKRLADKLILILGKLFEDLHENVEEAARYCGNNDASTALYATASAINMTDIPYLVREALEVPHTQYEGEFL